jgi:hypothetical protein
MEDVWSVNLWRRVIPQMSGAPTSLRQRSILALLIASLGLSYGIYRLWDAWSFTSQARQVAGEIVDRDSARLTIRYIVGGQAFQIQEDLPSTRGMSAYRRMQLQPGAQVPVLYDPASPQKARWDSDRIWAFPIVVVFISVLTGLAGLRPDVMFRPLQ